MTFDGPLQQRYFILNLSILDSQCQVTDTKVRRTE